MLLFPGAVVGEKRGYDVLEGCLQLVERLRTVRADSLLIARSRDLLATYRRHCLEKLFFPDLEKFWT